MTIPEVLVPYMGGVTRIEKIEEQGRMRIPTFFFKYSKKYPLLLKLYYSYVTFILLL